MSKAASKAQHSFIVLTVLITFTILPDGYLYALSGEGFAKRRGLNNSRELLRRIDLELVGEDVGEDRCLASVQPAATYTADIYKVHLEPRHYLADGFYDSDGYASLPEPAFGTDG